MSGKRFNLEMAVGLFMIVGLLCFGYLAVKLGEVSLFGNDRYLLQARFTSISGIKDGAPVEIAGVRVGEVSGINLDGNEYEAVVDLSIAGNVRVQEDAIASIRSTGIIGDKFVQITPGGSEDYLEGGMEIVETESSVSLEELISKYIFEK
jgi:phospholipid/cholesterol/gamma-HCH transport system substrate-binding protein